MLLHETLETAVENPKQQEPQSTPYRKRLWALLVAVLLLGVCVEVLTRAIHDHRKVTLNIEHGLQRALVIRHDSGKPEVLFAGNSLIFEDLQQKALQQELGAGYEAYTAGVPGSTYYDWRYGLQALQERGSQPDVVVFSISPSQFARTAAVTPTPISVLWSPREIIEYQREQGLNLTKFSELFLEHYSVYYSLRDIVRIFVRKFIPGYEAMMNDWSAHSETSRAASTDGADELLTARLRMLQDACGPHTRLMLLIPPTNQPADEAMEPVLKVAAAKLGIPIIEPIADHQWPLTDFQDDGYHLNVAAATEFSKLVADTLKSKLASPSTALPDDLAHTR